MAAVRKKPAATQPNNEVQEVNEDHEEEVEDQEADEKVVQAQHVCEDKQKADAQAQQDEMQRMSSFKKWGHGNTLRRVTFQPAVYRAAASTTADESAAVPLAADGATLALDQLTDMGLPHVE